MSDAFSVLQIFTVIIMPLLVFLSAKAYQMSQSERQLIQILERRNKVLSMRVDKIENEKDAVEKTARDYRNRVSSLEHDLRVMREQMVEIEAQNRDLKRRIRDLMKGIDVLMKQIGRHDSQPDWQVPKDDEI